MEVVKTDAVSRALRNMFIWLWFVIDFENDMDVLPNLSIADKILDNLFLQAV